MPLLDHFHPPLSPGRSWESFHSRWATAIADALDRVLPPRYSAEVQVHLGARVEADVAEFERDMAPENEPPNGDGAGQGVAVAARPWAPPVATAVMPALFPDDLEVLVRDQRDDARVVAVVELVSPRNKDRPESRRAFAAKSAAYLQRGLGLVVADIVTERQFNLHNELIAILGVDDSFAMPKEDYLYATAYRPTHRQGRNEIDLWVVPLAVGGELPLLPLALKGGRTVPLDLEAAYEDVRRRARI